MIIININDYVNADVNIITCRLKNDFHRYMNTSLYVNANVNANV